MLRSKDTEMSFFPKGQNLRDCGGYRKFCGAQSYREYPGGWEPEKMLGEVSEREGGSH